MNYFEYGYDLDEQQRIDNEQYEYLCIKDIANKVAYSEKQVIRVVRNLFKQGKLTRIKKQITSGRPTYFYGHST